MPTLRTVTTEGFLVGDRSYGLPTGIAAISACDHGSAQHRTDASCEPAVEAAAGRWATAQATS